MLTNVLLPEELTKTFENLEFQNNGGVIITSLNYSDGGLNILFKVLYGNTTLPDQFWQCDVVGVEKEKVTINWAVDIQIYSDHILLYEFIDNYVELYFNGQAVDSEKLFLDLYRSYTATFSRDIEFGYGINAPEGMLKLCNRNAGLFARGSKKILQTYEKCLLANGVRGNFVGEINSEDPELMLLVIGESYFIGKEFRFSKLSS